MITLEEAVVVYAAAWNENDAARRHALLERCWADEGLLISNIVHLVGRAALFDAIAAFRRERPTDQAIFTSGIDHHHDWFRFTAVVVRPDGTTYSEALDVGQVGPDGRITQIITFHGPLPPVLEETIY